MAFMEAPDRVLFLLFARRKGLLRVIANLLATMPGHPQGVIRQRPKLSLAMPDEAINKVSHAGRMAEPILVPHVYQNLQPLPHAYCKLVSFK